MLRMLAVDGARGAGTYGNDRRDRGRRNAEGYTLGRLVVDGERESADLRAQPETAHGHHQEQARLRSAEEVSTR